MSTTRKTLKIAAVMIVTASTALAFASGPPSSHTGAPGEANCTVCHTGTVNSGSGSVAIQGVPEIYTPGEQVTLTVRVRHPDRRRWGFQLTALDSSNRPAGIFTLVDPNRTRLLNGSGEHDGRVYVEHTSQGTFPGQSEGAEWEVKWTAPGEDVGRITFYAAGNAANNNGQETGDNIYTTMVRSGMAGAPSILAPKYKKGKIILVANGSDIENGATLEVSGDHLAGTETFTLVMNKKQTKWLVKAAAKSTPSNLTVNDVLPVGATVTLIVRNPGGAASPSETLTR